MRVCVPFPFPLEIERTIILPGTLTQISRTFSSKRGRHFIDIFTTMFCAKQNAPFPICSLRHYLRRGARHHCSAMCSFIHKQTLFPANGVVVLAM